MDGLKDIVALTPAEFAAVVALFLPGFVSIKIDRLIHPGREIGAAEMAIETLGYSLLNAGALSWAILLASNQIQKADPNYVALAGLAFLICLVGPIAWPVAFRFVQRFGADRHWVVGPHRFAWDKFFSRNEPCWVIVHLKGGALVGGYFGPSSYATVEPESGHIYLEELWQVSASGRITQQIVDSKGALFRPGDYDWIELFEDRG